MSRWHVRGVLVLMLSGACRQAAPPPVISVPPPVVVQPAALSEWPTTLSHAMRAAEAGNYEAADQVLLQHGLKHAGSPEGAESDFWRAILKADPSNTSPSTRERIALFDAYLTAGPNAPRYLEAIVFRRLLEAVDSTRTALMSLQTAADTRQRTREEEIKKLSEDLDRTMAELDRIKKRLAPKPPA
ncbi:MAG: hypothetical protein ACT4P7_01725 [Gemmatimonadaceae bacterium]